MYNKKIIHSCFLDFYQEAPFPHVLGSICCSCPIDAEGGKLSFIFSKKYFNFIIFTKQTLSTMCKISSCVRATFSFCRSVRYLSIGVSPTHSKLYGTASPFLQCFARRESSLPSFAATGRNSQEPGKFSCACRQSTRKAKQSSDALWDAAVRLFPRAAFHHADLSVGRGAGHPLSNILLTNCRQNLSQTIRKAPEILGFQELFLELLGRFELPTSSLPIIF